MSDQDMGHRVAEGQTRRLTIHEGSIHGDKLQALLTKDKQKTTQGHLTIATLPSQAQTVSKQRHRRRPERITTNLTHYLNAVIASLDKRNSGRKSCKAWCIGCYLGCC